MVESTGLVKLARHILENLGISEVNSWLSYVVVFAVGVLCAAIVYVIMNYIVVVGIRKITLRTSTRYDDTIFTHQVLARFARIFPVIVLLAFGAAFDDLGFAQTIYLRALTALLIALIASFLLSFVRAVVRTVGAMDRLKGKSLNGIGQLVNILIYVVAAICIVSVVIDKSPTVLLAGIGASAAVVSLVFKDTLVGFVAGFQLSANNMLSVGDWIVVPQHKANGIVTEVTLNTVKVRNWDNTITTMPPSSLVSDSFCNYKGMQQSGGRRITRSVNIDMNSVAFASAEQLERWQSMQLLSEYFSRNKDLTSVTNLTIYRAYLLAYLKSNADVNTSMTFMVRNLEATEFGLPVEVYCFAREKVWVPFEAVQASVMDFMIASLRLFDLRVYQVIAADAKR